MVAWQRMMCEWLSEHKKESGEMYVVVPAPICVVRDHVPHSPQNRYGL